MLPSTTITLYPTPVTAVATADTTSAVFEFVSQPFGAVGAVCIMLAVTVVNSMKLKSIFPIGEISVDQLFNGLNLVGGSTLLVNAVLRDEVVWIVLETYFVVVAVKGITQSGLPLRLTPAPRDRRPGNPTGRRRPS